MTIRHEEYEANMRRRAASDMPSQVRPLNPITVLLIGVAFGLLFWIALFSGIARANARPAACADLVAAECMALHQEARR
ncbi:hypothetical protein PANO111632_02770 [Paracoccus nototheniae]|uniref:Uncharacterized protein n=1 Tax=Paracoccus nototheniae TaxID=2489002 RepID=A0ABW4DXW3_9RHOB|nr:hypothetical protein [Paracoccus nototheniae]